MRKIIVLAALLVCTWSQARNPDGTLSTIILPNEGTPVMITPGGTFNVLLRSKHDLALTGTNQVELAVEWAEEHDGVIEGICRVPENLAPGPYQLEAVGKQNDIVSGAVYVINRDTEEYDIFHIPQSDIGKPWTSLYPKNKPNPMAAIFSIHHDVDREGYKDLLDSISTYPVPTIVIPGSGDPRLFEAFFGPLSATIPVGLDTFLRLPNGDHLNSEIGEVHRLRRAMKASRWSIGLSPSSWETWDMRSQLTLLVDNPLDMLLVSNSHEGTLKNPWDTTIFSFSHLTEPSHYRITPNKKSPER